MLNDEIGNFPLELATERGIRSLVTRLRIVNNEAWHQVSKSEHLFPIV